MAFTCLLVVALICPSIIQAQTPSPGTHPVMAQFAIALRKATFHEVSNEDLLSASRDLAAAAGNTKGLEPHANEDMKESFDRYLEDLRILSADLVGHAERGQTWRATSALQEIRNTCVMCHSIFRPDIESTYPNRGNIIRGQVSIEKAAGERRTDRSNVVVFLDRAPERIPYMKDITISQADRVFTPRVTAVVKGTTIKFPNDDSIFHNVFSLSKNQPFDLDIYSPGKSRSVTFERPGWAKVYCNIHPNMVAHVIVLDNPYFAVSDAKGNFVIPNVPDGEYNIRTWHEFASSQKTSLQVTGGAVEDVPFHIREDKRLRAHKDKFGNPYKGKY
jgi:plastocyanin